MRVRLFLPGSQHALRESTVMACFGRPMLAVGAVQGGAMAATTNEGLREVLCELLGATSVEDFTDPQLQKLLTKGWNSKERLRVASRQDLLAAGLNDGQAAQLRAFFQGRVHVHVLVGKEMEPEYLEVLDADGGVSFKPLQEQIIRRGYKLSGIAVVDEPTEKPAYQKLATYNPVLRAGQHVYLRAEPTGKAHWLLDLIAPDVLQKGVSAH